MENSVTTFNVGLRYGMYLGLLGILLTLITQYSGLQDLSNPNASSNWTISLVTWGVTFSVIYLGIKFFRENNEGLLSLGEGMTTSLYIGVFSGIISALFTYLFFAYMAPDALSDIKDAALDNQEMSEDEREAAEEIMGALMSPTIMAFTGFFGSIISAAIFGFIGSLILRKGDD
jgi:Na+/H+-dicarboxylate symporter